MKPNQLLNTLVKNGEMSYNGLTVIMDKNTYKVYEPDNEFPVFQRNHCGITFWELCQFLGIEE